MAQNVSLERVRKIGTRKVGEKTYLMSMCESVFVKQTLPLSHHSLLLVIQKNNLKFSVLFDAVIVRAECSTLIPIPN